MKDRLIDDFSDCASWIAVASGQSEVKITGEPGSAGHALRLDFDFKKGGGFVGVRKKLSLKLPDAYAFSFRIRGQAPRNKLEFKLVDPGGQNVWRWQEEAFDFRRKTRELQVRNRQIEFAWGPAGGGTLRRLGSIEFIISAGPGGKGTVWLEDFRFEDRAVKKAPRVTASGSAKGCEAQSIIAKGAASGWRSAAGDRRPWLQLDFHQVREYGGLIIDWKPRSAARAFVVQASDDGANWRTIHHRTRRAEGARSFVYLPRGESRFLRLEFGAAAGIRHLAVEPFDFSRSLIDFFHAVAVRSPRGWYPRYFSREQSYWTCAGVPDGVTCALINEDGLVEPDKGTFSIEPFIHEKGRLMTWADARRSVRLEKNGLPIPSAQWRLPGLSLETTVFATGHGADAVLYVRYRVRNTGRQARRIKLFLALRPYQVTPPWQGWKGIGGVCEIKEIAWKSGAVLVNRSKIVVPLSKPVAFGAAAFEHGVISDYLAGGRLPGLTSVRDEFGFASAAMRFDLSLASGAAREVFLAVPFGFADVIDPKRARRLAKTDGGAMFAEAVRAMERRLGAVTLRMPPGVAREAARTFRSAAGHILINRDGPALQPGPRRYTRSWIRDGAIMGAALLRIGDTTALPEFIRWFAPHQREDGFVPCCVDRTGPDWLVEHDSHGQLIFAVRESFRFTCDRDFLREMWPHVQKAAAYLEAIRSQRLGPEFLIPGKNACYGLLPESVSHEGYLAHPVHAYWDDFWARRGLQDAAAVAQELGHEEEARHLTGLASSFRETLRTSVRAVIAEKNLRYVPASVEWADFDPTATANAITMLQGTADLPMEQLDAMFALYMHDFRMRHGGRMAWNNYTAYEIRIVGALAHLGKRAEALELLEFFLSDRRPRRWNQWPEISWRDPRSPGHLGDVPHTWVAAEYMLAFATLFAYEREADEALIIGAGIAEPWVCAPGGVAIRAPLTWHGMLDLSMQRDPDGTLRVELGGDLTVPRGGFVLRPPGKVPIGSVTVNGRAMSAFTETEVVIRDFPAKVIVSPSRA